MSLKRKSSAYEKALVILNPIAGRRRQTFFRKTLEGLKKAGIDVTVRETGKAGDAMAFAKEASLAPAELKPDLIIAAGGDGTINEVVNGMKDGDIALGIIPMGTANVLARDIGLRQRSWQVARTLARGYSRRIHLGRANHRRFVMMVGVGFDARVVARVDVNLKYKLGRVAYALAGVRELLFGPRKLFDVTVDGQTYQSAWVVVAKGHHFGGGFVVAREANLEDPSLVACILPSARRIDLARYLIAIALGRIHHQPDVTFLRTQSIELSPCNGVAVEIDGDLSPGTLTRLSVAESLELVQPA